MNPQTAAQGAMTVAEMLAKYGPWGMCVILIVLLVAFYWHINKKHERQIKDLTDLLEKRNNQLMALAQKCSNALTTSTNCGAEVKTMLEEEKRMKEEEKRLLERTQRVIDRCRYAAKVKED
jgi:hypothetical protein